MKEIQNPTSAETLANDGDLDLFIEDLEDRTNLEAHGACVCSCSCDCTSCSCVAWAA